MRKTWKTQFRRGDDNPGLRNERCRKLTEEYHDDGVYPVRIVRLSVALNAQVRLEVALL